MTTERQKTYWKTWYEKNGDAQRAYNRDRNARVLRERKTWVAEQKAKPCVDCGVQYPPWVMQFDHVRGKKIGNISTMLSERASKDVLKAEIEKCDVVCANCHADRTYRRSFGL